MANRIQLREAKRGQMGQSSHGKYRSKTRCPKCGLMFVDGLWKREMASERKKSDERGRQYKLCPACIQIRDGQIGGIVQFSGTFMESHREELLNRIRNLEKQTGEERPLERIIKIKEGANSIEISATTEHLVARLGKSIQRDFGGDLDLRYAPEDKFAFVHWHRDI
jgi:hypothetical protein